jgi:hypothetical protein
MYLSVRKRVASGLAIIMIAGAVTSVAGVAEAHGIRGSFPHYSYHHDHDYDHHDYYHHDHDYGYWGGGYSGYYAGYDDCATSRVPILNRFGVVVGYRYVPTC